jgi:hypothetical protein
MVRGRYLILCQRVLFPIVLEALIGAHIDAAPFTRVNLAPALSAATAGTIAL